MHLVYVLSLPITGILPPEKDMYLVVLDHSTTTAKRLFNFYVIVDVL